MAEESSFLAFSASSLNLCIAADLIDRTVTPVENALHYAGLKKTDINMVLLVGGSTRIPAVQEKVRRICGIEPSRTSITWSPISITETSNVPPPRSYTRIFCG